MKKKLKIILRKILVGLGIVFGISAVLTAIYYKDVESYLTKKVYEYIEDLDYGTIEVASIELSVFRHFPNIAVKIDEVYFYETTDSLQLQKEDPILAMERLDLIFNSWKLLVSDQLAISGVSALNGQFSVLTYPDGRTNIDRTFTIDSSQNNVAYKKTKRTKSNNTAIINSAAFLNFSETDSTLGISYDIKNIYLNNVALNYSKPSENIETSVDINNLRGNLKINGTDISCDVISDFNISKSSKNPLFENLGQASINLDLDISDNYDLISIDKGRLFFNKIGIDIKGYYDHKSDRYLDLQFDANSNDLALLALVINQNYLDKNSTLIQEGDIDLDGTIKGSILNIKPAVNINFSVENLNLAIPNTQGAFRNVGFTGRFSNREGKDYRNASLSISNLQGETPGGQLSGSLKIDNFNEPYIKSDLAFSIQLNQLDNVFNIPEIDSLSGLVSFNSKIDGQFPFNSKTEENPTSWDLELEDVAFNYKTADRYLSNLNARVFSDKGQVTIENIQLLYDESDVKITGELTNLYHLIFKQKELITTHLEISSNQYFTKDIVQNKWSTATIKDRMSNLKLILDASWDTNKTTDSVTAPIDVEFKELSFNLDTLPDIKNFIGKFRLKNISAKGMDIDLYNVKGSLKVGDMVMNGKVILNDYYGGMEIHTHHQLDEFPHNYMVEMINALSESELNNTKLKPTDELILVNGGFDASIYMEYVPFNMTNCKLESKTLVYKVPKSNPYISENLSMSLDSLFFSRDEKSGHINGIETLAGSIHVPKIDSEVINNTSIHLTFEGKNDFIDTEFYSDDGVNERKVGHFKVNYADSIPEYDLYYQIDSIATRPLLDDYDSRVLVNGDISIFLDLNAKGSNADELSSTIEGAIKMTSDSLSLTGIDLDKILTKYKRSQNFNLIDVSAVILAGPVGPLITKGADFTNLAISADLNDDQSSFIPMVVAEWQLKDGLLMTKDVAFSTNKNRVAFDGSFDIAKDSIPNFSIHVVDKKGCSLMEQTFHGKTDSLQVGNIKLLKTLLGSVINLGKTIVGANCEVVYEGEVPHPDN